MMNRPALLALLITVPALAAAAPPSRPPASLPSSARMTHDRGESWTYVKSGLDLSAYRSVMIEPTVVYAGRDAQFGDIPAADRRRFASVVTDQLRSELGQSIPLAARAGVGTIRLRVTLLGVEKTKGGLATATRATPLGLASSAVRSLAGKEGRFTGSIFYAVELFDGANGELQAAAVRRRAPDALDIPATLSTSDTVKAVARDLAGHFRERLEKAMGR
jgi:uncharacterized protein DUF3313